MVVPAHWEAHEFDRIDRPATQDRGPEPKRRIGPDRVRIRDCEPTELPVPRARQLLGDPTASVRMAMVLPYLLKAHDTWFQLVEPGHDLMPTFRPPGPNQGVDVELYDAQHALRHALIMP